MLFAFNGTGNKDEDDNDFDTNVTKIVESYQGISFYQDGVGTGNWFMQFVGGLFGYGGKARVKKAIRYLTQYAMSLPESTSPSPIIIDVAGFSRGAALALDFCNRIQKLGYHVRCLMLFDTVASFGIAGNDINLGYSLNAPTNTTHIFHAMSKDECRDLFPITRVKGAKEVWFKGYHSDIGGGNGNVGLNSVALAWMMEHAESCGVPFDSLLITKALENMDYGAEPKKPFDLIEGVARKIKPTDLVYQA